MPKESYLNGVKFQKLQRARKHQKKESRQFKSNNHERPANKCYEQEISELTVLRTTKKLVTDPSRILSPSFDNKSSVAERGLIFSRPCLILTSKETPYAAKKQLGEILTTSKSLIQWHINDRHRFSPHPIGVLSFRQLPPRASDR